MAVFNISSLQAYNKATESNPDLPVAWEGLLKFYEKNKPSDPSHHTQVLQKLISFYKDDPTKHFDVCSKLAQLQLESGDVDAAVETLRGQAENCETKSDQHRESLSSIIKVLTTHHSSLTDQHNMILLEALETVVSDNQTPTNMENMKHLIKLQYKLKNIQQVIEQSVRMISIFSDNIYPLEWLCKIYTECSAGLWSVDQNLFKNIEVYFTNLSVLSDGNTLAKTASGAHHFNNKKYSSCRDVLKPALDVVSPNIYALFILCQAQIELKDNIGTEISAEEALKHIGKVKDVLKQKEMKIFLKTNLLQSLYNQFSDSKMKKALNIIDDIGEKTVDVELISAKVYASQGLTDEAEGTLKRIEGDVSESDVKLVQALISRANNDDDQFLTLMRSLLEDSPDQFEVLVLLGQMLYHQDQRQESLGLFLRAAKLHSTHWLPFLYLGKHYHHQQEDERARKCYQKSLQLSDNNNAEAATALSDILRRQGRHQENLQLLTQVVRGVRGGATWAWLRLGVHYLSVEEPGPAVTSLQSALRSDPEHVVCWEALGDAYVARGSYVAARKAFEKVLTLCPDSVYSQLMIAEIKQKLGYHSEAISDYNQLLSASPDYLPALRGLAETYLAQAGVFLEQFVDKNVVDCVEAGLTVLTRAAVVRPGLAGTWRLMGELCSLVTRVSEELVSVPSVLLSSDHGHENSDTTCDKSSVLQLGIRCFTKSLVLEQDNAHTWHDLGLLQSAAGDQDRAVASIKKSISLDSRQGQFWCSLGLVHSRLESWSLAQHCYIKSLSLETSAVTWTNLGVVYLHLGEHSLANKAFKEAQNNQPDYIQVIYNI